MNKLKLYPCYAAEPDGGVPTAPVEPAQEPAKPTEGLFTQDQVNAFVAGRVATETRKLKEQYEQKLAAATKVEEPAQEKPVAEKVELSPADDPAIIAMQQELAAMRARTLDITLRDEAKRAGVPDANLGLLRKVISFDDVESVDVDGMGAKVAEKVKAAMDEYPALKGSGSVVGGANPGFPGTDGASLGALLGAEKAKQLGIKKGD